MMLFFSFFLKLSNVGFNIPGISSLKKYIPKQRIMKITIMKIALPIFEGKVNPMKSVTRLKLHKLNKCPQIKLSQNLMKLQIVIQKRSFCIKIFFDFHFNSKMIERKIKRARMTIALPKIFIMLSALFNISLEAAEVSVLKSKCVL